MTQCSTLINLILIYIITLMGNCSASEEGHSRSLELDLYLQSNFDVLNLTFRASWSENLTNREAKVRH
jgi:hypothetical protein